MRYNGGTEDVPLVDNVVDLKFELLRRSESAGVSEAASGRSQLSVRRSRQLHQSPDALHADNGSLASLPAAILTDGPMCGGGNNQFDADLLRVRKVRVTMRVQAANPALRGADTTLFRHPGTSQGRREVRPRLHDLIRGFSAKPQSGTLMTHHSRLTARLADERGTALIIALMAMMLLTALGAAVVMVSNTETHIAGNYRNSQEALYAADAGVERVVQDLLLVPRWNDILNGSVQSGFIDGAMTSSKTLPGGGTMTLCCGPNTATSQLQSETDTLNLWGANNPQWKLFAWGPLGDMLPNNQIDSPMYVAVWIADDPAETDGNPAADVNGTLTLHAEALDRPARARSSK